MIVALAEGLSSDPAVGVAKVTWSGDWTLLNPSRFWNGLGDGNTRALVPICCDFDPVEFVPEYTRLVFLPESQLDPNNPSPHPAVFGGVFGSVLLLSGVEDIVSTSTNLQFFRCNVRLYYDDDFELF